MYCKNCGKQIDDDSKFCRFCGTALDANFNKETSRKTVYEGEIHKCPNCGQTLNSFTAYCPACGYEIQKNNIGKSPIIYFTDTLRSCFTTDEMENLSILLLSQAPIKISLIFQILSKVLLLRKAN